MPNLSDYVAKPILLLFEAKLESKISGGIMHKKSKRLEYFLVGDDYSRAVAPKKIEFSGGDANVVINDLWIKHISDIDCSHHTITPLGKQVFSTDGKLLGVVTDLVLSDEFVCTTLLLDKEQVSASKIITFGDDIVLVKGKRSPKITKYISKKVKYPQTDNIRVKVLDRDDVVDDDITDDDDEYFDDEYPITEPITLAQAISNEQPPQKSDVNSLGVNDAELIKKEKSNSETTEQECDVNLLGAKDRELSEEKSNSETTEQENDVDLLGAKDRELSKEKSNVETTEQESDVNLLGAKDRELSKEIKNLETAEQASKDSTATGDYAKILSEKEQNDSLDSPRDNAGSAQDSLDTPQDNANIALVNDENDLQDKILNNAQNTQQNQNQTRKFEFHNPFRIISNYSFLLGRLVTKTIFSFNRELIVKKGDVITTPIVEKARHAGKLVELTLNSKK